MKSVDSLSVLSVLLVLLVLASPGPLAHVAAADPLPVVAANDNRRPAGIRAAGVLTLRLRAGTGRWQPEGPEGPAVTIEALGELDGDLVAPAPLIRVPEGTHIAASVRNDLPAPLTVHGLCARDGAPCPPLVVPPGDTREARFASGAAGTYHYWATAFGAPVPFREMAGAFIVDPAGSDAAPDRVFVITEWTSLTPRELGEVVTADDPGAVFVAKQPAVVFMVNGHSWPATERLHYRVGEAARWRVLNLSSQPHPMHLHGFYFTVESSGNGLRDGAVAGAARRPVVTHLLPPGGTMAMTWVPERAGNWLFHCHLMEHVSPLRRLQPPAATAPSAHAGHGHHGGHDPSLGMAGLVLGVTVSGPEAPPPVTGAAPAPRALTLALRSGPPRADGAPVAGFMVHEGGAPASAVVSSPGPVLVLQRGEPVAITLENHLTEATAIHWHGMELESYYDGVHGFSGNALRQTPIIEPGGRFVARFTPPRAGTFIYHSHLHDHRQLSSGLYGALIVVEPGTTLDPATDHVLMVGRHGLTSGRLRIPDETTPVVLNGVPAPRLVWAAGTTHRLRLINITADDIFEVTLRGARVSPDWTPAGKDGAALPAPQRVPAPARQMIAVGETYDFEVTTPPQPGTWWLEVRTAAGKWQMQSQIVIK